MCTALALPLTELPLTLIDQHSLHDRVYERGEKEVRFYFQARPCVLPVWWNGRLHVVRWGNHDRSERKLPPTGWTWEESVSEGKWSVLAPEPVKVPANYIFTNGVWVKVKQGVEGLLVRDRQERPVVFLICRQSTRYYQVMTRSEWMPALMGEVI
ncbi:hypothetical protein VT84_37135 [Gemmata sp. SH-PL17]|uniref:hypothetical protein n=1 Tax=Gemmata sp. SH-PL17 TaxID=1630693 RepID=UPI00078B5B03|nr:hypothetical protein [Gemmata sp. SH-PL17]AMV30078.1 hypothetical protein VT84_37135 [Gemmata sp. SH-PL17]